MINYDLAREFSLKHPTTVHLMRWQFANMVYYLTDQSVYFWQNVSTHHRNGEKPVIPNNLNETYCVVANGVVMAWREAK